MADDLGRDHGREAEPLVVRRELLPGDLGRVLGHEAVNLAREVLDDLGPTLVEPLFRRGDLLAVLHHQRIGQVRMRICSGFVEIGVVGRMFVARPAGAQLGDAELVHHVLTFLLGGEIDRRCG